MKKLLYILYLSIYLFGSQDYELQLYEKILPSLFKNDTIKVYADNNAKEILNKSSIFKIVSNCSDAIVVLIGNNFTNIPKVCQNKPIFATSYKTLKQNSNSFGAFYWKKGRPQLQFKNDVLTKFHLRLSKGLKRFAQ